MKQQSNQSDSEACLRRCPATTFRMRESMATNLEGALLAERYQVHTRLATGGMSVVYRAWDTRPCRPLAIKALRGDNPGSSADIARFRREAHAAALLQSPYIVESYDFFRQDRRYFMAMELVEGPHLK